MKVDTYPLKLLENALKKKAIRFPRTNSARFIVEVIILLIAAAILAGFAGYFDEELADKTTRLRSGSYLAVNLQTEGKTTTDLYYFLEIQNRGDVNIYIFNQATFNKFENGSKISYADGVFAYDIARTNARENVRISGLDPNESYYLVIDNTALYDNVTYISDITILFDYAIGETPVIELNVVSAVATIMHTLTMLAVLLIFIDLGYRTMMNQIILHHRLENIHRKLEGEIKEEKDEEE